MSLTSPDHVLVQYRDNSIWNWEIWTLSTGNVVRISDVPSGIVALSPDGKHIIYDNNHVITVYDVVEKKPIGNHGYPDDCNVYHFSWGDNKTVYIASTYGVLEYSLNDFESLSLIIQYSSCIKPEYVCDIQRDRDSELYVIRSNENGTGFIQMGTSEAVKSFPGRAACLFRANNCFFTGPFICYMRQDNADPHNYYMNVVSFTKDDEGRSEQLMPFKDMFPNQYPLFMCPDPVSCTCQVFTQSSLLEFDMFSGLFSCFIPYEKPPIAVIPSQSKGSVVLFEKQMEVVEYNPVIEEVIRNLVNRGNSFERIGFHIACRIGAHDTDDDLIRRLTDAIYSNNIRGVMSIIKEIVSAMSLPEPLKVIDMMTTRENLKAIMPAVYSRWVRKGTINWMFELECIVRNLCNLKLESLPLGSLTGDKNWDIAKRLVEIHLDVNSELANAIFKEVYPDDAEREQSIPIIQNKYVKEVYEYYKNMASKFKEYDIVVDGEEWEAVLEECFEDEKERENARAGIREFMCCVCCGIMENEQ